MPQGHHGRTAYVLQLLAGDRVVVTVGQYRKPVPHECGGGLQQSTHVGKQGTVVPDHLQLDQVRLQGLPRELRGEDRIPGRVAAGGVGQDGITRPVDQIQHAFSRGIVEIDTPDAYGHDLRPAGLDGLQHDVHIGIARRTDQQPGTVGRPCNGQFV